METVSIRKVLDLALHLVDTTTGGTVYENTARFYRDGEPFIPAPRGDGMFVLIDTGREDFELTVEVKGYETITLPIRYEELEERLPLKDVHLIPVERVSYGEGYITLKGSDDSISSIEAIRLDRPCVNVSSYNERRSRITLIPSEGRYVFTDVVYALLDEEGVSYQYLYPGEEYEKYVYTLKAPLTREFHENSSLHRIIRGMVSGGTYLLRVKDEYSPTPYLIRYVKAGEEKFMAVDMDAVKNGKDLVLT